MQRTAFALTSIRPIGLDSEEAFPISITLPAFPTKAVPDRLTSSSRLQGQHLQTATVPFQIISRLTNSVELSPS
jgi:hypothetical protein